MLLHARPYTTDPGTDPIAELVSKEMKTTGTQTTESSFARTQQFSAQLYCLVLADKSWVLVGASPRSQGKEEEEEPNRTECEQIQDLLPVAIFLQIHCQGLEKIFKKHRCEEPRANPKDFLFASEGCKATFVSGLFYFLPAGLKLCLPKQQKHLPGPFSTCDLPLLQECNDDGIDLERHLLP